MKRFFALSHDEIANTLTHVIGLVFFVFAIPFLLIKTQTSAQFWSTAMFGLGLLMVFGASTAYHAVVNENAKKLLRVLDHISIYFLIAGTYTPFTYLFLPKDLSVWVLVIIWVLVAAGTIFKLFATGKLEKVSTVIYVLMGWMVLFMIKPFYQHVPSQVWVWIVAGGAAYTFGVLFYIKSQKKYFHAIWHLMVLAGAVTHFIAIYLSVVI